MSEEPTPLTRSIEFWGCRLWFIVRGEKGAVCLQLGLSAKPGPFGDVSLYAVDLGRHWSFPICEYDHQSAVRCRICYPDERARCFYDGSTLNAQQLLTRWAEADWNVEVVWKELEGWYRELEARPRVERKEVDNA